MADKKSQSKDAQNSSPEKQQSNANPAKLVNTDEQKEPTVQAQEAAAKADARDNETRGIPEATAEPTAEEQARTTLVSELERQGQSGNPFLHSSDGNGRPYNPEVDGKPGKEAEAKQRENDDPKA